MVKAGRYIGVHGRVRRRGLLWAVTVRMRSIQSLATGMNGRLQVLTNASPMFHVTTKTFMASRSTIVPGEINWGDVIGAVLARESPWPSSCAASSCEWALNNAWSRESTLVSVGDVCPCSGGLGGGRSDRMGGVDPANIGDLVLGPSRNVGMGRIT